MILNSENKLQILIIHLKIWKFTQNSCDLFQILIFHLEFKYFFLNAWVVVIFWWCINIFNNSHNSIKIQIKIHLIYGIEISMYTILIINLKNYLKFLFNFQLIIRYFTKNCNDLLEISITWIKFQMVHSKLWYNFNK